MPLTEPTKFKNFKNRRDTVRGIILKLTDGTDTWYLGTAEVNLTDAHVYNLIIKFGKVHQNINIFKRTNRISNISITLSNLPYKRNSSGQEVRISDEIENIVNHNAEVYLFAGGTALALSDCLLIFKGKVAERPSGSTKSLKIVIKDKSLDIHKHLPSTKISDVSAYSEAPVENRNKYIPIIYGTMGAYRETNSAPTVRTLIPAIKIGMKKAVVADHVVSAIDDIHSFNGLLNDIVRHKNKTVNTDDAGRGTIEWVLPDITDGNARAYVYICPHTTTPRNYNPANSWEENYANNPQNATDQDIDTYAEIINQLTTDGHFLMGWLLDYDETDSNTDNLIGLIHTGDARIMWRAVAGSEVNVANLESISMGLRYGDGLYEIVKHELTTTLSTWLDGNWHGLTDTIDFKNYYIASADPDNIYWHYFIGRGDTGEGAALVFEAYEDGTSYPSDKVLVYLKEFVLAVLYYYLEVGNVYADVKGRKFGSWIDAGGRSNSYDEADLIDDIGFIVESILRDYLGLTSTDIDMDSFDDAENSNITALCCLHNDNRDNSYNVLRQLCEQSHFAFFYSSESKVKLIRLNNKTPSTDVTIYWYDLIQGINIKYSEVDEVIKKLIVHWDYRIEHNAYKRITVFESSSSISTKEVEVNWPNLDKSSITWMGNFLVGDSDSILGNDHELIEFKTVGFKFASLEIGDHIELDSISCDPHLKRPGGVSWSGAKYMIIEKKQTLNYTEFGAIKLY